MKRLSVLFYLIAIGFPILGAQAQEAKIETASITFEFPAKKVKGSITGFTSSSKIDWGDLENSFFEGSVAVSTLDTNNGLRNWSLRSSRYFNAKDHPRIRFKSSSIQKQGDQYLVNGDLTIKGITKPFEITMKKSSKGLTGKASLYSSEFDINIKKKQKDNLVLVYFKFDLAR